ncbi:hypothetical protein [Candidatus Cardinium hertigii]|uniref:hypothetical protein n=1 Tax=Candidatus Cardinium hertigii TaxID=247481 RepID=UPI003D7E90BB
MNDKEQKITRNYSFKMTLEEYKYLRDMHMKALDRGFDITFKGVIQSCIEIVNKEGIKEEYCEVFQRNSKNIKK